jgi:hypothetical protein
MYDQTAKGQSFKVKICVKTLFIYRLATVAKRQT